MNRRSLFTTFLAPIAAAMATANAPAFASGGPVDPQAYVPVSCGCCMIVLPQGITEEAMAAGRAEFKRLAIRLAPHDRVMAMREFDIVAREYRRRFKGVSHA